MVLKYFNRIDGIYFEDGGILFVCFEYNINK